MNDVAGLLAGRSPRRVAVTAALLTLVFALLAGGVTAQDSGSSPELVGGERLSDTAVEVRIADDVGVDTDTITAEDFLLSDGQLTGISVTENGTEAVVELVLDTPIQSDDLTVALAANSTIADVDGNRIENPAEHSITVEGMDGVPPTVEAFTASNAHARPAELTLTADERLETVTVDITGPGNATLTRSDFERVGPTRYEATVQPSVDGVYEATLVSLADESRNEARPGEAVAIDVRLTDPDAVAMVDVDASQGPDVTFDATYSSESAVNFTWSLGDGTTATGERITHEFAPGVYTVELTATDEYGNNDTDTVTVSIPSGNSSGPGNETDPVPAVTVERPKENSTATTLVRVGAVPAGTDIRIDPDDGRPLLADERVTLDRIELTLSRPTDFGIVASTVDPASFERDTVTVISGFSLAHDLPPGAVDQATLSIAIPEELVSTANVDPAQVQLHREGEDGWELLRTTGRKDDDTYRFEATATDFSRFAVVTTQENVDLSTDDADGTDSDENGSQSSDDGSGTDAGGTDDQTQSAADFLVQNATVSPNATGTGELVTVEGTVANTGNESEAFLAGLFVDGELLATQFVGPVDPGTDLGVEFTRQFDEPGTYSIRINGTSAGTVAVESNGGGGIVSTVLGIPGTLLGILPLGFLPGGLIRTVLLFVGLPVALIFLALKGFATYRGY
ncbi:PKD domain-containing protein [Halovenus marina]|uniref:PKD domain-containing protein n=1 Tax=Halovenus marina TaxID=3396621 RepID=UPI003F56ECFC